MICMASSAACVSLESTGQAKLRVDLQPSSPLISADDASLLRSIERRVELLSGTAMHADEMPFAIHFTPPVAHGDGESSDDAEDARLQARERMSLGIHVDTNNCRDRRWLTFIIYLRTTPFVQGGHTVFPLAIHRRGRQPPPRVLKAAETLLSNHVQHTGAGRSTLLHRGEEISEAARVLVDRAGNIAERASLPEDGQRRQNGDSRDALWLDPSGVGVAVAPVRGSCVAFFTRSEGSFGRIDPYSWHGGAAVLSANDEEVPEGKTTAGKWTFQKFREVPRFALPEPGVEGYALRHSGLPSGGCGGGVFFEVESR